MFPVEKTPFKNNRFTLKRQIYKRHNKSQVLSKINSIFKLIKFLFLTYLNVFFFMFPVEKTHFKNNRFTLKRQIYKRHNKSQVLSKINSIFKLIKFLF